MTVQDFGKVLMVEPNLVRANQFTDSLEQAGWLVERAESIQDAIGRMNETSPEAVGTVVICPFVFEESNQMNTDERRELRQHMATLLQKSSRISLLCDQNWEGPCPPVCSRCPIRN